MIKHYKDLRIYRMSYQLALEVHQMTNDFPNFERYELGAQIRRASLSIPLNIAEGYGKKDSSADFKRFLKMSLGSNNEVKVLLDFAKDLNYIEHQQHEILYQKHDELGKQIYSLIMKWQ